jgi:hypothetical protein
MNHTRISIELTANPIVCLAAVAALLVSATLAHATVGESGLFSFDTRDSNSSHVAESGVFAFDTRLTDGLSDDGNSGGFVLDTRSATLTLLAVDGPSSVGPSSSVFYTANVQAAGGGMENVTTASQWSISGAAPPGTVIGAGELRVGTGTTGGTFAVRASYQSPAGRVMGERLVSVVNSIKASISHSVHSLGGNNYQVQLNGSASGAVGSVAFQWATTSGGALSNPQAQNPTLSLSSTGGRHEVTLEVTDSAAAHGTARRSIFIDKPSVPNQPGKLAPASDGGQGAFLSMGGVPFQFDPARIANGVIVLTHGLKSGGSEEWIRNLAARIAAEIPAAQRPNIVIYDWEEDADPNGLSLPTGSGVIATAAKRFSWVGKLAGTALTTLTTADFMTDMLAIKPMGMRHGVILGNWLVMEGQANPPRVDFSKPVHFIGHSAGGFVVGEAAWILKQKNFIVDRITMLDTPLAASHHLTDLPNPGVVDRYVSSYFGLLESPGTWNLDDTEYQTLMAAFPDGVWALLKGLSATLAHDDAHEWYRSTVYPDPGFEFMGFHFSPFKSGPIAPRPSAQGSAMSMASIIEGVLESAADSPVSAFQVFGNAALNGGVWSITEGSDAGIFAPLALPPDAVKLRFKYRWSGTGDGDFLGVRFGARPELMIGPDLEVSRGDFLSAEVEIGTFAGLSDDLVFTLVSRGSPGAILQLKDILIVQDDDADKDGLSTAQELALGTHCQNPDTDGDSIGDLAELTSFPPTNPTSADTDGDGVEDSLELQAGTDPTNGQSYLRVTDALRNTGGTFTLRWPSQAGRFYNVQRSADVTFAEFDVIGQGIAAALPQNTFVDTSAGSAPDGRFFYRIEVYVP